jgi:translation initiation factor 3 subunit C
MQSNKFWADGSSSESDVGDDSDSENEVVNNKVGTTKMYTYESDSDSEDEVREVKSHKDKAWDEMVVTIKKMKMAMKIDDWSSILDEFKTLNKIVEKSKMLILKNGLPTFYIRILYDIETLVTETLKDKAKVKGFKALVAKSFNTMKLTIRKHNKNYEEQLEDLKANPSKYPAADEESSSDEESDSESDASSDESDSDKSESDDDDDDDDDDESDSKSASDDGSSSSGESDDSLFDDDSDSSSDSDSDDSDVGGDRPQLAGRAKWLKKTVDTTKKGKVAKKPRDQSQIKQKVVTEKKVQQVKLVEENMTEELLEKKLNDLIASRGRKGTDAKSIVYQLEVLAKVSRFYGAKKEIPVLMHLISAMFDGNRTIDEYMDLQTWRTCRNCMMRIVKLLDENKNIVLGLVSSDDITDYVMAKQKQTDFIKKKDEDEEDETVPTDPNLLKLVGSMENYLMRLEDEYTKSLQRINPHTQDYVVRLSDEAFLLELAEGMQKYFERVNNTVAASEVALLRVEHQYYKHNSMALQVKQAHNFTTKWGSYNDLHPACTGRIDGSQEGDTSLVHPASFQGNPSVPVPVYDADKDLENLCSFIFKYGDDRRKTRALLCAVYHHAMHDRYYRARDLFLISHIQDNIDKTDTKTQILYNRTLVTLGLCAFRAGLIHKAYDCLSGVCTGRVRELLAQGQTRSFDKDPEQEKAERRRQMPYHMHINPDLLECCYLTCAMLIELPQIVSNQGHFSRGRSHYRKYLQSYNRQVFTGPPENTREHILAASKSLIGGDWKRAIDYISNLEVWNLIPDDGGRKVKEMLALKIKDEGLRVYLFRCANNYDSMSLSHLCGLFDMDKAVARRIISKMIFRKELSAAWDQCSSVETLMLNRVNASTLQQLTQQMADRISYVMENNERILDPLTSSYGYKDEWSGGRDSRKHHGDGGQRRHQKGPHWKPQNANSRQHSGNRGGRGGGRGNKGSRNRGGGNYRADEKRQKPMGWGNVM